MWVLKGKASSATNTPFLGKCNLFLASSNAAFKDDFAETAASFAHPFVPTTK